MNVAVFTGSELNTVNGFTTTLSALVQYAPPGVRLRIYTAVRHLYVPRCRACLEHARADAIDVVHQAARGPAGLAATYVAKQLGLPMVRSFRADRSDAWPRGVDTVLFSPKRRSERLREQWEVSCRRPAILCVGRLAHERGVYLLPRIQSCLHSLGIDHRFVIVGDGPMQRELREQMPDSVFTGVLSRPAVADVFASADVFVFPNRARSAGTVVLEAQASGVPVAVTDEDGPRSNMVPGATGIVRADDDPLRWGHAIAEMVRGGRLALMAESARAYALTRQWERALRPLYRAYEEACVRKVAA
jgi:glycosyltransferase involved in cell wall biosynthesis